MGSSLTKLFPWVKLFLFFLWVLISPNFFPPPDSSGEMPAEEAMRDLGNGKNHS
jgi:hypothetical protein